MHNHLNAKIILAFFCAELFGACSLHYEMEEIQRDDVSILDEKSSTKSATNEKLYYWHKGEKIQLSPISGKKYIVFKKSDVFLMKEKAASLQFIAEGPVEFYGITPSEAMKEPLEERLWAIVSGTDGETQKLPALYWGSFFMTPEELEVGLSHLAYVKLKKEEDIKQLESYSEEYGFNIIGNNEFMPLWVTIDCTNCVEGENALSIANTLYETGLFQSAQPDLIAGDLVSSVPNDPLFSYQWNLFNSGQYGSSYAGLDIKYTRSNDMSLGSSDVSIAVIDQGVELTHPDINLTGYCYDTINGSVPSIVRGNHGTACAGIITAQTHNNLGVAGIAPYSKVMSISHTLTYRPNIGQELANGFSSAWTHGAAVISNSWGGVPQSQILEDAIQDALDLGRSGKGCVVVFAAGNDNTGTVSYPASAIDDIIAVGAMSPDGKRKDPSTIDGETWWGSNYGAALDIVAPGVKIPTTDRTGSAGYNTSGDYHLTFNGTSSACPHVAAVAALVISVVPTLSQQQVVEAILTSTYKLPSYSFPTTKTYGTWNQEVGYGLLNAKAAIQKAVGTKTIYYYGRTVSNEWVSLIGTSIYAGGVTVHTGSKLSITASSICQISTPLVVESGASFVIQD